jgi:hypothetical protein
MKKCAALVFGLLFALALAGCASELKLGGKNEYETDISPDVGMTIADGTLTATGATVELRNDTDGDLASGNGYDLLIQAEREDGWYDIETGEWTNTAEARLFAPGTSTIELSWADSYGALPPGRYRILKGFWPETEGSPVLILSAEFEVKK